ncbi:Polycomb group protein FERTILIZATION-INDEPENDENT ENDOSPERM [Grifola frondosa]|uniref:Polycomb group protein FERTILIZATION-INDEPENDENT ENDOSPERM n=1 Tax=Grifola frondosa TaxID=5627 RepID=A0A1C7MR83_GRIFR|nr:Polycomb group protein FERTILIZATION-INDEPENDENT ENDOSPERM [Grifola frondosa]
MDTTEMSLDPDLDTGGNYVPWYRASTESQPFILSKKLTVVEQPRRATIPLYSSVPWTEDVTLWNGQMDANRTCWIEEHYRRLEGRSCSWATGRLIVYPRFGDGRPFSKSITPDKDPPLEVRCVAWTLRSPTQPFIVFTISAIIYVLDVRTRNIVGTLQGHGGPITSIAVHPRFPNVFCTTSRDFTTRIYDLTFSPVQKPNNPHWPPSKHPSLAGPAHGLQTSEPEGPRDGFGQCIAVLVGGRSGGHKGAVFGAAFHRSESLIATCGMDRAVKIWRIPQPREGFLARDDKPLFSTDMIHKARVLSIAWLSDDVLISHSAPSIRMDKNDNGDYEEGTGKPHSSEVETIHNISVFSGSVVVAWVQSILSPQPTNVESHERLCQRKSSDFDNYPHTDNVNNLLMIYACKDSFTILSAYILPMITPNLHVYWSPTHDPFILIPIGKTIRLFNITHFGPCEAPDFPLDDIALLTKRLTITDDEDGNTGTASRSEDEQREREEERDTSGGGADRYETDETGTGMTMRIEKTRR